jgi:hypothetical protein
MAPWNCCQSSVDEGQLARLGEITRKTFFFYRNQTASNTFDLVDIAEAALRIHWQSSPLKR